VDLFFVISGLLITMSWFGSADMADYLRKRVLRIYPGFVVAMLVSLGITALNASSAIGYLKALKVREFFESLLTLDNKSLDNPLTFSGNPYPHVANGSLWTIQGEFKCYLLLVVVGLFGLLRFRLACLTAFLAAWAMFANDVRHGEYEHSGWRFFTFFAAGAIFYLFRDKIPSSRSMFLCAVAVLVGAAIFPPWLNVLFPLAGSYAMFFIALNTKGAINRLGTKNDLSYGIYLYAFLIQQSLIHLITIRSPLMLSLAALPITFTLAMASWHLVEKPFLGMKKLAVKNEDPTAHKST
jgi:peptidoglycan/LPS O-acetylase OafA/YrhL